MMEDADLKDVWPKYIEVKHIFHRDAKIFPITYKEADTIIKWNCKILKDVDFTKFLIKEWYKEMHYDPWEDKKLTKTPGESKTVAK